MGIRVSRNLNMKNRKVYTFDNFRGVDFSTSPYKVAQNRAISAQNLIYADGLVRKRNGWKSLLKFSGRINGIFSFELNDEKIMLVYAGTSFYTVAYNSTTGRYESTNITDTCTYGPASLISGNLVSRRVQLYINKNKAYIVGCGDYIVYGKYGDNYELRRVYDDTDTFVPTTTINIDEDGVNDTNRASLDSVNLLSSKRKNEMLGVDAASGTWTVDTAVVGEEQAIDDDSDLSIMLYTLGSNNENITKEINNRITSDKTLLYEVGDDVNSVGSIDYETGKITLNINTKPQEADTSNIIITFKKSIETQANVIKSGTVSVVFGGGGNSNRLFIGGNSTKKHVHVWSEMYDFTYFADTNHDEIGSDSSAIMGYVRATDGILLVFKEKNGSDATIYYVSGTDTTETDSNGNAVFITQFKKYTGNITDTILGKYATDSLNGDNLILTSNGVKGLSLTENLTTNAYRVQERSRNINNKLLKEENLNDACAIVYKDKYYLSINDHVYICDSAFTFTTEAEIGGGFNYEWWYFTNVDARVWCEIDDKLFFGTSTGQLCVFEDNFTDTTFQYIGVNNLTITSGTDKIAYNVELDETLKENDTIEIVNGDLFALWLDSDDLESVDENGNISFSETLLPKIYEGIKLYADTVGETGLSLDAPYLIQSVNLDNLTFTLCDEDGETVIPTDVGFRLCKKVSGKQLYITDIDVENSEFKVREFLQSETLDLIWYNSIAPTQLCAYLCFKENVVAIWYSPIYDLGTNMYSKTLLGMTVATEPLMKGKIQVGYQTRNIEKYFTTYGNRGFNFDDIDFDDFSFEGSFANSNSVMRKERNFNFIMLRYISDTQTPCAVSSITIRYKINRLNKGVR